ncbi:MAG: hypothetical protein C0597_14545 [Marinilabiliales bacterium]|nr:MAG: hypothetical protein C0597_14545 [Marinilabiliales bacterium]
MKYKVILFILSSILSVSVKSQIQISKTNADYSLSIKQDSVYRILSFWKDNDSTIYSSVKYTISDFTQNQDEKYLEDEIIVIQKLWDIADDSIQYNLESFNIAYPIQFTDVLKNHISAFLKSKDWQNHVNKNGKKLDYDIIKKVMLENDIYMPLNEFLKTKGYQVIGFSTEKHGFVTEENLQRAGFNANEIIPMPFIVWVKLEKN